MRNAPPKGNKSVNAKLGKDSVASEARATEVEKSHYRLSLARSSCSSQASASSDRSKCWAQNSVDKARLSLVGEDTVIPRVRVWCDGCFDLTHWGHFRAWMQCKCLGETNDVIVGIHDDRAITQHKGYEPVLKERERYEFARSIRFVDEVVEGSTYQPHLGTLDMNNCDYCTHGEDITTDENGIDCFHELRLSGRFRTIKRSDGVSTTRIVDTMLKISRLRSQRGSESPRTVSTGDGKKPGRIYLTECASMDPLRYWTESLPEPKPIDLDSVTPAKVAMDQPPRAEILKVLEARKVVYVAATWDLLHLGHAEVLRAARGFGDFVLVGIYDDETARQAKGKLHPIQPLTHRAVSVVACQWADGILLEAPYRPTQDFVREHRIDVVLRAGEVDGLMKDHTQYGAIEDLGIVKDISADGLLTTDTLIRRIGDNWDLYCDRNKSKGLPFDDEEFKKLF